MKELAMGPFSKQDNLGIRAYLIRLNHSSGHYL